MKIISLAATVSLLLIVVAGCLVGTEELNHQNNDATTTTNDVINNKPSSARDSLAPPKLFDFERFKSLFKKSYGSMLEELARKKIFFVRAFHAFLSLVSYKHYKSSSYLKVNEMSDWTEEELRALDIKRPSAPGIVRIEVDDKSGIVQPAADIGDIESKLKEIVEQHKDEPGYKEIIDELNVDHVKRSRRSTPVIIRGRESLTIDNLFEEPKVEQRGENYVESVKSNNPHYEVPELTSYGSDGEDDERSMLSELQSKLITSIKGSSIISSLVSGATSLLSSAKPAPPPPTKEPNPNDKVFYDYRKCLTPVKNQKGCGSCYIFSTTALYEWQYCKETGKSIEFSEQYPLDCGKRIGLNGCGGGQESDVSQFYYHFGLELNSKYRYHHKADSCPYSKETSSSRMGYLRVSQPRVKTIFHFQFEEYIKTRPILLGFGVGTNFHAYGGGVDKGETCDESRGHSMLVVGSGIEDGLDYWLLRNSYGPSWGIGGYYKISKTAYDCFLDGGIGWVLAPQPEQKVFSGENLNYDNAPVQHRLDEDLNKFHFPNLFSSLFEPKQPNDPNMVTPSSK